MDSRQKQTGVEPIDAKKQTAGNDNQAANTFDLLEIRIKDNTVLDGREMEHAVYPFLGRQKNLDAVEQARAALEKTYHDKGYQTVGVDIPEQTVTNGVVYLQVVEGKVSSLRVTNSRYFSLGAIKAKVPELAEGVVPNMQVAQAQINALSRESADRSITPYFSAGETPGTLDVNLKVKDQLPFHGKVELNGRNTATTDRLRSVVSMHYDNLWQKFHSASLMFQTAPENTSQVELWVGNYAMPIIDREKRLVFFVLDSSSNSITNAGELTVVGAGRIYGLRFVDHIPTPFKDLYQTFTAGISYKSFQQNLSGAAVTQLFQKTPISYLPFLLGYTGNLRFPDWQLGFNLNANFSIRGLGNREAEFNNSRYLAKSDYAYLNGGVNFKHTLPYGMELAYRFNGQVADQPLIPTEQFSIGGMHSVRGYYETEVLADDGIQTSLEVYSPNLPIQDWPDYNTLRVLTFFDFGNGWIENALSGSPNQYMLASAGAGFRAHLWKTLTANLDVGIPFTSQNRVEKGNPRLHFQVFTEF